MTLWYSSFFLGVCISSRDQSALKIKSQKNQSMSSELLRFKQLRHLQRIKGTHYKIKSTLNQKKYPTTEENVVHTQNHNKIVTPKFLWFRKRITYHANKTVRWGNQIQEWYPTLCAKLQIDDIYYLKWIIVPTPC